MEKGESKKRGDTTCCVPLCHSNSMKNANFSFHKIPVKAGLRETRMNLLGITKEPVRSHKVCSLHFPGGKKLHGTLPTAFIQSTRQTEKCIDRYRVLETKYNVLEEKYKQ